MRTDREKPFAERYWEALAELRAESGAKAQRAPFVRVNKLLTGDGGLKELLLTDFGVHWGAYGLGDPDADRFRLLVPESSDADVGPDPPRPAVALPMEEDEGSYRLLKAKEAKSFIAHLFLQQREARSLRGKGSRYPRPFDVFGPEFFQFLPGGFDFKTDPRRCPRLPIRKIDKTLHELGCHYCSPGEMLFFMLSWRVLLRCFQRPWRHQDFDSSVLEIRGDGTTSYGNTREADIIDVWSREFMNDIPEGAPERTWHSYTTGPNKKKVPWDDVRNACDGTDGRLRDYLGDWVVLGLIKKSGSKGYVLTEDLEALVWYMHALLGQLVEYHSKDDDLRADIATAKVGVARTLEIVGRESVQPQELQVVNSALLNLLRLLLYSSEDRLKNTPSRMLGDLHEVARFPVLPYFYWLAVQPSQRAHLVFPTWRAANDITVLLRDYEDPDNVIKYDTNVLGLCLLAVRPLPELEWRAPDAAAPPPDAVRTDLCRLQILMEQLARPLVDSYFNPEAAERSTRHGAWRQAAEVAHQTAALVDTIKVDPDDKPSIAYKWLLSNTLSIYGSTDMNVDTPLDQACPDFKLLIPEWRSDLLGALISAAMQHAVWKIAYRPKKASATWRAKVQAYEEKLISPVDPPGSLYKALRCEVSGEAPSWLLSLGGAVVFHHCLWQAAAHAFFARCDAEESGASLRINLRADKVTIENRNRPEDLAAFKEAGSKDQAFYRRLNERITIVRIEGPEFKNGWVLTRITKREG